MLKNSTFVKILFKNIKCWIQIQFLFHYTLKNSWNHKQNKPCKLKNGSKTLVLSQKQMAGFHLFSMRWLDLTIARCHKWLDFTMVGITNGWILQMFGNWVQNWISKYKVEGLRPSWMPNFHKYLFSLNGPLSVKPLDLNEFPISQLLQWSIKTQVLELRSK